RKTRVRSSEIRANHLHRRARSRRQARQGARYLVKDCRLEPKIGLNLLARHDADRSGGRDIANSGIERGRESSRVKVIRERPKLENAEFTLAICLRSELLLPIRPAIHDVAVKHFHRHLFGWPALGIGDSPEDQPFRDQLEHDGRQVEADLDARHNRPVKVLFGEVSRLSYVDPVLALRNIVEMEFAVWSGEQRATPGVYGDPH